jgi:hypothetical protein
MNAMRYYEGFSMRAFSMGLSGSRCGRKTAVAVLVAASALLFSACPTSLSESLAHSPDDATAALADNLAGPFVLTEDATRASISGLSFRPFTGTLDGNGHEISLAICGRENSTGIFAKIGSAGTVKDLKVSGSVGADTVTP